MVLTEVFAESDLLMEHGHRGVSRSVRGTRAVQVPAFGKLLKKLRNGRTRAAVCEDLRRYGIRLNTSTLFQYERGTVRSPDPVIVLALTRLYQQPSCDAVLLALAHERSGHRRGWHVPDLSPPLLDPQQVEVAEWWGRLDAPIRDAVYLMLRVTADDDLEDDDPQLTTSTDRPTTVRGRVRSANYAEADEAPSASTGAAATRRGRSASSSASRSAPPGR